MDQTMLDARIRTEKGKGAARRLRKNNQIPAIFYGPKTEPVMLAVDFPELEHILKEANSENIIFDLQLQTDQGKETRKAMIKDIMLDPVSNRFLHADFYEISLDRKISISVPIDLLNTPIGVKNGGILQPIRRELIISCLPDNLIQHLEIDVSGLEIGDSLHIRDIELPEGIECFEEAHLTIAVVAAPSISKTSEEEMEEEEIKESAEKTVAEPESETT